MDDNRPIEKRLHYIDTQRINLEEFKADGKILDIGGGGEGIIGQVFDDRVVAIDPSKRELEEAPKGPLKIVMDAKNLGFLDNTFDSVTSFFTMMFIPLKDHGTVLREIHRVLRSGGELHLWDVVVPPYDQSEKDIFAVPLQIKIEGKVIETGYGTKWKNRVQDALYFENTCKKAGFKVIESKVEDKTFYIRLKKI